MDISPLEIQKKEFSKSMRGYNKEEVDEFLERLTENYEKIYKENKDLKEQIEFLEGKIQSYKEIEATLKNTLVLAEKTAEEVKINAQKEREIILKQASMQADKILRRAEEKTNQINNQNEELIRQFYLYKTRFKNFLQSQLDYLDCLKLDIFSNNVSDLRVSISDAAAADDKGDEQAFTAEVSAEETLSEETPDERSNIGEISLLKEE
ncbi:DivIVA domain protein [Tepidanaerobacter acetatoxydans Re1]|uniref:DivIVA domain protein n=1 Tax=Tepidanaerobacter acetatoxydans (strain DSM 21804 / JCM 16047 / Re1) TaxID=1209989 RepID=F4LVV9_TEPAE|nr:DivIVA domain-containing protein [Tepidanaerobacter acetatoxydans]AEE91627.1 DivIVA domain protein [Tepidanaerobacter acetatoxydans Re1]CCP26367.1 DivIVA domain protein [Tepidanaerobacter acetatoxydans Re1]